MASLQAVAVLPAHHPRVAKREFQRAFAKSGHLAHAPRGREVYKRSYVHAPGARVSVEGRSQSEPFEKRDHVPGVAGQVLGGNRDVLYAGNGLSPLLSAHQDPQSRPPGVPYVFLIARRSYQKRSRAGETGPGRPEKFLRLARRRPPVVSLEFHHQNRLGVSLDERHQVGESPAFSR